MAQLINADKMQHSVDQQLHENAPLWIAVLERLSFRVPVGGAWAL
ncbi:hypothetical protein [Pseudomonas sp.]